MAKDDQKMTTMNHDTVNTRDKLEQTAADILPHLNKGESSAVRRYLEDIQKPDLKPEDLVRETRNLVSSFKPEGDSRIDDGVKQMRNEIEAYARTQGIGPVAPVPVPPGLTSPEPSVRPPATQRP